MVLEAVGRPLVLRQVADPEPAPGEVRLRVEACGVCRTDLHVVDGELPAVAPPVVPGHEVVGRIDRLGPGVHRLERGQRVGVPWLGSTCGTCEYCLGGRENLCDAPGFTGYTRPGGFASHLVARADFCIPLPEDADPVATAPLLCAGLIGWRALGRTGQARTLGIYGFGAAAHLVTQVARHQGRRVYAFTRAGDLAAQAFARAQGAAWAGDAEAAAPEGLDAAIIFAPAGELVPVALKAVRKGGRVVCGGIHMSDIPAFPYRLLWEERELVSVANLTRADATPSSPKSPAPTCTPRRAATRWRRPTKPSTTCATAGSPAPRCWCRNRPRRDCYRPLHKVARRSSSGRHGWLMWNLASTLRKPP